MKRFTIFFACFTMLASCKKETVTNFFFSPDDDIKLGQQTETPNDEANAEESNEESAVAEVTETPVAETPEAPAETPAEETPETPVA